MLLDHNNPMQWYRLEEVWLGSCPTEKELEVLADNQLSMSQHYAQMARRLVLETEWSAGLGK